MSNGLRKNSFFLSFMNHSSLTFILSYAFILNFPAAFLCIESSAKDEAQTLKKEELSDLEIIHNAKKILQETIKKYEERKDRYSQISSPTDREKKLKELNEFGLQYRKKDLKELEEKEKIFNQDPKRKLSKHSREKILLIQNSATVGLDIPAPSLRTAVVAQGNLNQSLPSDPHGPAGQSNSGLHETSGASIVPAQGNISQSLPSHPHGLAGQSNSDLHEISGVSIVPAQGNISQSLPSHPHESEEQGHSGLYETSGASIASGSLEHSTPESSEDHHKKHHPKLSPSQSSVSSYLDSARNSLSDDESVGSEELDDEEAPIYSDTHSKKNHSFISSFIGKITGRKKTSENGASINLDEMRQQEEDRKLELAELAEKESLIHTEQFDKFKKNISMMSTRSKLTQKSIIKQNQFLII